MTEGNMSTEWEMLRAIALEEIEHTLEELPEPLRKRAATLPVTFQPCPNAAQCRDGTEPDTLGLFVGPDFADAELTPLPIPPQIILFLDNLWEEAEADEEIFRAETRTTYLHELGHYLGLDEEDLFDRGLD
jgi:predicted Zn-dependent protease with MMP-like domain